MINLNEFEYKKLERQEGYEIYKLRSVGHEKISEFIICFIL